jgi:broad specificity phosphatase PhoE
MREGGFAGADEPPDAAGLRKVSAAALDVGRYDAVLVSPAEAAKQTAAALGLSFLVDERLRDIGHGHWQGLSFAQVHAQDPNALAAWIADPAQGAPGGESMASLRARMSHWLAGQEAQSRALVAITHPMIIRAVLSVALGLPDEVVMRFDIAPLSVSVLSYNRGWRLQAMGR